MNRRWQTLAALLVGTTLVPACADLSSDPSLVGDDEPVAAATAAEPALGGVALDDGAAGVDPAASGDPLDELSAEEIDPYPVALAPDHPEWSAFDLEHPTAHDSLRIPRRAAGTPEVGPDGQPVAAPSCNKADLKLTTWPVSGTHGKMWMIHNYTDLDASAAKKDYKNKTGDLARNYDGHRGADICIPSMREMDAGTALARASAPGVVEFIREDQFDRNTSCTGTWNVVVLRHANGWATYYGHLKKNSVPVIVGQSVVAGQTLGVVGSSGCSTQAHLHFEVHDCNDAWVESFDSMWTAPPAYEGPSDVMDVMLKKGAFASANQLKDPAANVTLYKPSTTMGVGLSAALRGGDSVQITMVSPTATTSSWTWTVPGVARYGQWFPSWTWTVGTRPGTWTMKAYVNGSLRTTRTFKVSNYDPGFAEVAQHGVSSASFQEKFDDAVAAGYRPVWLDGFALGGSAAFNLLYRPVGGVWWIARAGMTSAQYQAEFDTQSQAGRRLLTVDSYTTGGAVRYNAIWTNQAGTAQTAYHGVSEAQHQATFNTLKDAGWRPVNVSVVGVGGARFVTALWDKAAFGTWSASHGIAAANYQTFFDAQTNAGRRPHYIDAYTLNGSVWYSVVFSSASLGSSWVARHDRTSAQHQTEWETWTGSGFLTKLVTGVDAGGTAKFAAIWTK